jgi:hypothetical protein
MKLEITAKLLALAEPRAEAKGNAAQYRERVSKALARIRQYIVAVDTRGGSRMRESCTYGSMRGARGNSPPYRDVRRMELGVPDAVQNGHLRR